MTPVEIRQAIITLIAELFPGEEDTWLLKSQPSLNGQWPSLAMQRGQEEAVYTLLLRLRRGN